MPDLPQSLKHTYQYNSIKKIFSQFSDVLSDDDKALQLENLAILEQHPVYKDKAFLVTDLNAVKAIYMSEATKEIFGLSLSDTDVDGGLQSLFARILPEHWSYMTNVLKIPFVSTADKNITYQGHSVVGLRMQTAVGPKSIMIVSTALATNNHKLPPAMISTCIDITHLFNSNKYWFRYKETFEDLTQRIVYYDNENDQFYEHDILSEREIEVLKLMNLDNTSDKIAELLGISTNTVNNHKQNMYARTGARNGVALVELMQMCGVI
jgi:DNA-binding CsgD family transcriptional regulator